MQQQGGYNLKYRPDKVLPNLVLISEQRYKS